MYARRQESLEACRYVRSRADRKAIAIGGLAGPVRWEGSRPERRAGQSSASTLCISQQDSRTASRTTSIGLGCATLRLWDGDCASIGIECCSHPAADRPTETLAGGELPVSVLEHVKFAGAGFGTYHQIMRAA